jgi:hypothetical protein
MHLFSERQVSPLRDPPPQPLSSRELFGQWPAPDPLYLKALELWTAYYCDCDAFDGTTGPVSIHQQGYSNAFARERHRRMAEEAMRAEIPDDTMTKARMPALDDYEQSLPAHQRERFAPRWR